MIEQPGRRQASDVSGTDWRHCRDVARTHGRTFFFASQFLPPPRRRAIHAAYAFCRVADDIVDRAPATGRAAAGLALDAWEAELDVPRHPIAVAFAAVREAYGVPVAAAHDLIAGVRLDLTPRAYATWDELERYCYGVAGTVGLIAAPILGCRDPTVLPHAVSLGIAMQLTNVLRDVAEDARMGRLYLPLADLAAFDCAPEALLAGRPSGRFADLIAFEIARARALYDEARAGIPALSPAGRLTALASAHLYGKILTRIEEQNYDVFAGRAHVPTGRKLRALPTVAGSFVRLYLPQGRLATVRFPSAVPLNRQPCDVGIDMQRRLSRDRSPAPRKPTGNCAGAFSADSARGSDVGDDARGRTRPERASRSRRSA